MEIFLHIDGQKIGPLTIYDVHEKLRRGDITPETRAWAKGMEEWQPLRDLDPLKDSIEVYIADAGANEITINEDEREILSQRVGVLNTEKPRPWLRFWARLIDTPILLAPGILLMHQYLGSETLNAMLFGTGTAPNFTDVAVFFAAMAVSWVITETLLLTCTNTTPGKWSFNIKIQKESGERLDFSSALQRSFGVFVFGMGLNYIISQIICNFLAYLTLTKQGKTYWDKKQNLTVTHHPVNPLGIIIGIFIFSGSWVALYHLLGKPELPSYTP
ncbi:MAG: RDD family protein [Verrucomicrobiales bacterium]